MSVQHIYSSPVTDGTKTSVVRPSDWNSVHNQFMTIAGNTAGQSAFNGTNIIFQGGNNITLSANTSPGVASIIISAYPQGAGTTFAGTNISGTVNTSGIQLSVAPPPAIGYQDYFMLMGA